MTELRNTSDRRPLSQLLSHPPAMEQRVAVSRGQPVSWQSFCQRISAWQQSLARHPTTTVAVYLHDSLEFAAALLALWQCGKVALLTGDCLPATLRSLRGQADALLGDFDADTDAGLPHIHADPTATTPPATAELAPGQTAVIVLTSGTTGTPKPIRYSLQQLDTELAMHEQLWGQDAGSSLVAGTVSHQHIYGLLWRVLWPLTGNRPLLNERCHYPEDLLALAQQWEALTLITTPTHLTRLPASLDWPHPSPWQLVVSSTAPLGRDDSLAAGRQLGCPVTEIYGSSETGGIAWRRQASDEAWQPLPGIEIRLAADSGALQIRSPALPEQPWLTTGDRARLLDQQRFRLEGRLDRIAKVEGKRVSLSAMEQQLQEHEWVQAARVLVLQGRRTETAAALCLSPAGRQFLQQQGKQQTSRYLKAWLGNRFELPVLPRRWRFVEQWPQDAQGKVPLAALQALFAGPDKPPEPLGNKRLPQLTGERQLSDQSVELQALVEADLIWFDGHFPESPILPGVVQLHWACHYGRQYLAVPPTHFLRMEVVKFQQLIRPGQALTLELRWQPERHKLHFRFYHQQQVFSSGRLVFSAPQPGDSNRGKQP